MKSIDVRKKHRVTLTFLLDEEVAPRLFAEKLARVLGGSILRPGEAVMVFATEAACVVTDETLSLPSFGYQWRSSLKKRPRPTKRPRRTAKRGA